MSLTKSLAPLRRIAVPGAPNLPPFAARAQGHFAKRALKVVLETTPSAIYKFESPSHRAFNISCAAFDNIVASAEGRGQNNSKAQPISAS